MKLFVSRYTDEFLREKQYLTALKRTIDQTIKDSPPGLLHIHRKNGVNYYTVMNNDTETGKRREVYLNRSSVLLPTYIKKYCAMQLCAPVSTQLALLTNGPVKYDPSTLERVLKKLDHDCNGLNPYYFSSNGRLLDNWQNEKYEPNPYHPEDEVLYKTRRGEMVRSKNECIAANMLLELNICYRYEYPVRLKTGKTVYPDFNILSHVNGREFFLEIMGKMHDPQYAADNYKKINDYSEVDLILNDNLLVLFEYKNIPFNTGLLEQLIRRTILNPCR